MNQRVEDMHEQNIELMRKEAIRLIEWEIELLEELRDKKIVTEAQQENAKATFTLPKIIKYIEVLQGEQHKLKNLEITLAIVGTMKAGKSTTINAIVGSEILPSRNRPMTALPTLIKHKPGQTIPVLRFPNKKPAHDFCCSIAAKDNREELEIKDPDLAKTMDDICNGWKIKEEYTGAEEIFQFLRQLNDLVRVSNITGIPFPYDEYNKIQELPEIEVQFETLRDSNNLGEFILLDTPGPNEAGMKALSRMMEDQLQKASAVLTVMDFTQLKSEADDSVRNILKSISAYTKGRLFALVNKYDQKDRNSIDLDSMKELISESLMDGEIDKDKIYPVSSKYGYLANCALSAVNEAQKTTTALALTETPWHVDFADLAFRRWKKEDLADLEKVRSAAIDLWEDSLFAAPLEEVIQKSHADAASIALNSAASKLSKIIGEFEKHLAVRGRCIVADVKTIQTMIDAMQNDIDQVDQLKAAAEESKKTSISQLTNECTSLYKEGECKTVEVIRNYFQTGKAEEEKRSKERKQEQQKAKTGFASSIEKLRSKLSGNKERHISGPNFDPKVPKIRFEKDEKHEAVKFVGDVSEALEGVLNKTMEAVNKTLDEVIRDFDENMTKGIAEPSNMLLSDLQERMNKEGVKISLSLPNLDRLNLPFSGKQLVAKVESKTEKDTKPVPRESTGGSVKRFFGSLLGQGDWGYDDVTYDKDFYIVDIKRLEKQAAEEIKKAFSNLTSTGIKKTIEKPLAKSLNDFFIELSEIVENIRGDLLQGLEDSQEKSSEKQRLLKEIQQLQEVTPECKEDTEKLSERLQ
ncbi:hypothetical protein SYK_11890 [Pseudodesulfovibrio nedwellii]|uniref:Dynamin N-terminal domain-containing protein n=1 Tax=Pseudodesulfovibrio nedwellii TaxID=2973072 RepID=A0ABN6S0S6_9BACT|nr:dynamin family protein [Pseudodesulfovibrio nedwellii]BDQ36829.1 hypothetical protein SYK_11890 [Pseudodesulfovibrio nedwellii]